MTTRKFRVGLVLIATLMLISSCGIPSYLQCDVTSNQTNNLELKKITGKISISNVFVNTTESDDILNYRSSSVDSHSPSYTFFYSLSTSTVENTSLTGKFNSSYSSENGRSPKSATLTINSDDYYVLEYGTGETAVRLFPFWVEGNDPKSFDFRAGHINKEMTHSQNLDDYTLDYSALDEGYLTLQYTDFRGDNEGLNLKRYNGEDFYKYVSDNSNDYLNLNESDGAQIGIYVAVNIVGSNIANFNNRFWSDLYYIGTVEAIKIK